MLGERRSHTELNSDELRWRLWLIWSVVLAAIPRTVRQGLEPSVPGLPSYYLLDIAVLCVALGAIFSPYLGAKSRERFERISKTPLIAFGVLWTTALLAVEAYVGCIGYDSLAYRRYGQQLILAEFLGGLISHVAWIIAQPKNEGAHLRRVSIALGFCCPLAVTLLSGAPLLGGVPMIDSVLSAVLLGISLLALRANGLLSRDFAFWYAVGQLLFSTIWWGRWISKPEVAKAFTLTLFLCFLGVVASVALTFYRKKAGRAKTKRPSEEESLPDCSLEALEGASRLSPRERQAIALTLANHSDSEIANRLGISKSTVASLRRRSYLKLGVSGKKELMETVSRTADYMVTRPSAVREGAETPPFLIGACLLVSLAGFLAVLAIWGDCLLSSYAGWDSYLARGLATSVLLFSCLSRRSAKEEPQERNRPSLALALARVTCSFLLACGARAALGPTYVKTPCWYALGALLLLVLAEGFESGVVPGRGMRAFWLALRAGTGTLPGVSAIYALIGAPFICLFGFIGYGFSAPGMAHGVQGFSEVLAAVTLIFGVKVIVENQTMNKNDDFPAGDEMGRVVLYLRGRGLSEVQAEAVALLAFGVNPQLVCSQCHVSSGSLGTFRTRAYKKLDVSGMDDLRILLEREAGMPKHDKVSPAK